MSATYQYRRISKEDAAVLLVDHQYGLTALVQDYPPSEFKNSIMALADMAKFFNLPTILTTGSELHRDWRNDIQGFGKLLCAHTPIYQSLMTSYAAKGQA